MLYSNECSKRTVNKISDDLLNTLLYKRNQQVNYRQRKILHLIYRVIIINNTYNMIKCEPPYKNCNDNTKNNNKEKATPFFLING